VRSDRPNADLRPRPHWLSSSTVFIETQSLLTSWRSAAHVTLRNHCSTSCDAHQLRWIVTKEVAPPERVELPLVDQPI
jgi:hypothetical protein